jgi:hypothetical protein
LSSLQFRHRPVSLVSTLEDWNFLLANSPLEQTLEIRVNLETVKREASTGVPLPLKGLREKEGDLECDQRLTDVLGSLRLSTSGKGRLSKPLAAEKVIMKTLT